MDVIELGRETVVRLEHSPKVESPMEAREAGREMVVRFLHQ